VPGPSLSVHPHREGPWYVVLGRRRLAVPPELGRRLLDLDGGRPGASELAAALGLAPDVAHVLLAAAERPGLRRGPRLRLAVAPAAVVRAVARRAAAAAHPAVLAPAALAGALLATAASPACGAPTAAVLGLVLAGALVHELGHAAALSRAGYPPGDLGLGLVLVVPVMWCDVSAAALLPRRRRMAVDAAGPAFQAAFAGLLAAVSFVLPGPAAAACARASAWSLALALWSLAPLARSDGAWLVADAVNVRDPRRLPRRGDRPAAAAALVSMRLLEAAVLAAAVAAVLRKTS
jgi:hypothetical protein